MNKACGNNFTRKGYIVHTLFSISEVVEILKEVDHLTEEEVLRINEFIGNKIEFKEEKDFLTNKN